MSSCDGSTLESWIYDSLYSYTNILHVMLIARIMEEHREDIECAIGNFEEEVQSWRTYRDSLWRVYADVGSESHELIAEIVKITDSRQLAVMLMQPDQSSIKQKTMVDKLRYVTRKEWDLASPIEIGKINPKININTITVDKFVNWYKPTWEKLTSDLFKELVRNY